MALTKVSGEVITRPLILTGNASVSGIMTVGTGSTTTTIDGSQDFPTIRPTLDLNFAATKTLDRRITFTRDSIGTYTDEFGIIQTVPNNVPRFDHDPITGESLGLLIEESRTNYIDNSNDLSQWNRVVNGATTTSNTTETLSPDGTNNSTKITGVTNSGMSRDSIISVSASTFYTASVFAKKGSADNFLIELGTGPNNVKTVFNINTKTFSSGSATGWFESYSTSYIDYPNGWVRVIISGTTSGSASGNLNLAVYGVSSGYVYFWGAQVEVGSFATSYIPTSGSTVTRSADNTSITGTNFSSWYNQTEGTIFCDYNIPYATNTVLWVFTESVYSNSNRIVQNIDTTYTLYSASEGTPYVDEIWLSDGKTLINKSATSWKTNDVAIYLSSGGSGTDSSFNLPINLGRLDIGYRSASGGLEYINGCIKQLTYYNKRLTNSQLQSLTRQ
jgi:hypothetical protein